MIIESKWLDEWLLSLGEKPKRTKCTTRHEFVDGRCLHCNYPEFPANMVITDGKVEINMTESERRCSRPSCNYPFVHEECWKCVKHCDCCSCMVHGCQGECRGKTNEDYIYEAVELCWRWSRQDDVRNSVDSGIRCMDINDPWIISTDDIRIGRGPGIAALVRQLEHQVASSDLPNSMDQLKILVDGGNVVSQAETERARDAQGNER